MNDPSSGGSVDDLRVLNDLAVKGQGLIGPYVERLALGQLPDLLAGRPVARSRYAISREPERPRLRAGVQPGRRRSRVGEPRRRDPGLALDLDDMIEIATGVVTRELPTTSAASTCTFGRAPKPRLQYGVTAHGDP